LRAVSPKSQRDPRQDGGEKKKIGKPRVGQWDFAEKRWGCKNGRGKTNKCFQTTESKTGLDAPLKKDAGDNQ